MRTGGIHELSRRLDEATKRPLLLAIDGGGGAGKSTLSQELHQRHPESVVIEMDDFYRPKDEEEFWAMSPKDGYENYFEWQRLRDQVLEPLVRGKEANYQRFDWPTNSLHEWLKVAPQGLVIVEGCFTLRPELKGYFDLKVWVEAPAEVRFQRMVARGHGNDHLIPAWMAAEEWYFRHIEPHSHADLVIPTS